ncbi:MAG TPA: M48 family metalloprotease [Gaiellaceae bacterium]|nr:M48 family metalloprotease [Gaiellaceae bacterium]
MSRRVAVALNVLKAWLLLAVPTALFALLGWRIGGYRVAVLFGGSIVLLAAALYAYADRIVMGMLGARELLPAEAPALQSTVERLASRAGVVKPRLYVVSDGYPRAFSSGRGGGGGAGLGLSVGLLGVASPAELEGIVAHELAHLRHRDVLLQSIVVVLATATVEASRVGGFLQRALLFLLGPVAAALVHLMLSPKREFLADRLAAELCDSPHGLADALLRLEGAMSLVGFEASPATEPLYTTNPFALEGLAALFDSHPPVGRRVQRLRELDPEWRSKLHPA